MNKEDYIPVDRSDGQKPRVEFEWDIREQCWMVAVYWFENGVSKGSIIKCKDTQ
jgi:hypothetical protein